MFGLRKPRLLITAQQQQWVDDSFRRLASLLGTQRFRLAKVILPTSEFFPDAFDGSESALQNMFRRVAGYMQVDPTSIDVSIFTTEDHLTRQLVPFYEVHSSGAAGLYHHDPEARAHISIDEVLLKDPVGLVAVLTHELGHIILLRPGLVERKDPQMEPLNDLLTIFLGFGIFTANSAFRFEQHSTDRSQGWSARRQGYLSEELLGYSLARFAFEHGESKPRWFSHLSTNVKSYAKQSADWLAHRPEPFLF